MRAFRLGFAARVAPVALSVVAALGSGSKGSAAAAEPSCSRWDLEVTCTTNPSRVVVTDPFTATVTVRNSGDMPLTNVTIQIRGDLGAHPTGGGTAPTQTVIEKLEPGETKQLTGEFASDAVGVTRVIAGARDAQGWAASNCSCTVDVIGLPAIQSDMSDKDLSGAEKGIFVVGEQFLYVLEVQNDAGTTLTPDLKVVYSLPKELEFVSGTADGGVTITGKEHGAESSSFVLAPNKVLKLTITVKAIAAPPSNLIQTRASIQTVGGVEVAEESESTTIKEAPAFKDGPPPPPKGPPPAK
jgi:uncharacterized repeat protein (TIGR01451 family)